MRPSPEVAPETQLSREKSQMSSVIDSACRILAKRAALPISGSSTVTVCRPCLALTPPASLSPTPTLDLHSEATRV